MPSLRVNEVHSCVWISRGCSRSFAEHGTDFCSPANLEMILQHNSVFWRCCVIHTPPVLSEEECFVSVHIALTVSNALFTYIDRVIL